MSTIRTEKRLTITEAHPYHGYLDDGRPAGNATVKKCYDHNCPLCRERTLFSQAEVIEAAKRVYGKPICTDHLQDAMLEDCMGDAVDTLLIDSHYWDYAPNL